MSAKATFWAWAQALPSTQKLVLVALAHRHNTDSGRCDPSMSKLAADCGLSRTAVKDALKAIIDKGLIRAINRQFGDVYTTNAYEFVWSAGLQPTWDDAEGGRAPDDLGGVQEVRGVGRQATGVGRQTTGGRAPDDHKPKREPESEPSLFPASDDAGASQPKSNEVDQHFDQFWSAYPRKLEKKGARAKFAAAVKSGVDPVRIVAAARRYAALCEREKIEERFRKHPTTWLNNGCWDDVLPGAPPGGASQADMLEREAEYFERAGQIGWARAKREEAARLRGAA